MKPRTVALYGSHLLMSAIGASLREKPQFQVKLFGELLPDITKTSNTAWPDVILFDLATASADLAISLIRKYPMIMLIGVDLMNNQMLVLSGEQSRLVTADDLVKVIERGASQVSSSGER